MSGSSFSGAAFGVIPPQPSNCCGKGMPVEQQQAAAVRYIQSALLEDVPLYVGNSRHDRIFVNDALFYFLAGRKSATRYHEFDPGVATTQQVQEEIVADLERHRVPLVVISNQFEHVTEPNESGVSSNVRIVDIFLNRYYRPIVTLVHYTVLARQPG